MAKKSEEKEKITSIKHMLIPKHELLSEKEKKELLSKYKIETQNLPIILSTDPAIADLKAKKDDIIKITRSNKTAFESIFYRRVLNE